MVYITSSLVTQVESVGYHTVFSSLAPLLIQMGNVYAEAAHEILHRIRNGTDMPAQEDRQDSHWTPFTRCAYALRLIIHILVEQGDDQIFVKAKVASVALAAACDRLFTAMTSSRHPAFNVEVACEGSIVCGSAAFWSTSKQGGAISVDDISFREAFERFGLHLAKNWHKEVRETGEVLLASMRHIVTTCSEAQITAGQSNTPIPASDDLEDILLQPGQLGHRM